MCIFVNIEQAQNLLSSHCRNGSYLGLGRIKALLKELGDPQDKLKYVHIAGTNGKGSTASMLSSVLQSAGYTTGLYTSPALVDFNERIAVNRKNIEDDAIYRLAEKVSKAGENIVRLGYEQPSEFEFVTAIAFLYFLEKNCDIVVLEVGMGGRLDATNVIKSPEAVIITSIGLDHTAELGNTLSEIAGEKAGIIKPGSTVITHGTPDDVIDKIRTKCDELNASLITDDADSILSMSMNIDGQVFCYKNYKDLSINLLGKHQLTNASLVIEAVEVLRSKGYCITEDALRIGLKNAKWHARLEPIKKDPLFLLDGAHNPHGVRALSKALDELSEEKKYIFICGILRDKDHENMLEMISPYAEYIIATLPKSLRAMTAIELRKEAERYCDNVSSFETVKDAIESAFAVQKETGLPICCFGSLYMSGDVLKYFYESGEN